MNKLSLNQMERVSGGLSWGCGFAIGGMIAITAGAAFLTGGAALAVFLISKGIGLGGLVKSCGNNGA